MAYDSLRIQWTPEMVEALRRLRNLGHSQIEVADAIGVSHTVIMNKCREMGLNQRMNRGAYKGTVERAGASISQLFPRRD